MSKVDPVIEKLEQEYPELAEEYKKIGLEMYKMFARKHMDYGLNNIALGGDLTATNATAQFANITASGDISASNLTLSGDLTATNATAQFANITASGDIICLNISSSNVRTHGVEVVPVQNNSSVDQVNMSQNGRKVIVKNQLQAQLNDGAFAEFRLLNTSIATDSIVLGSFIGNTAGVITGSIITAATTATSTASIQIHNETGGNIANDTAFTASFIVL